MNTKQKKQSLINFAITVIVFGAVFVTTNPVKAGSAENVAGWMWGGADNDGILNSGDETGLGWISMNNVNCDVDGNNFKDVACGGDNITTSQIIYGVNIPDDGSNASGKAWSENAGWLSFDATDLVGCPVPGTCYARKNLATGKLEGWARFLSVKSEFENVPSNSGGWEGWVSLGGAGYGVVLNADGTVTKGQTTSYAWSGKPADGTGEYGYIDFSKIKKNIPPATDGACGIVDKTTVSSLNATNTDLCRKGSVTGFTGTGPWNWSCTGATGSPAPCSANSCVPTSSYTCWNPDPVCPLTTGVLDCVDSCGNSTALSNCASTCKAKIKSCSSPLEITNWREVAP